MEFKAGGLIVIGISSKTLLEKERRIMREIRPAGVILFARNIESPKQLQKLCRQITECAGEPGHPPLILLDHEGGRVHRLTEPFTHFPSQWMLGQADDTSLTKAVFQAMAREISAVGANVQLGPVLDLRTQPKNNVIGDRAFGIEPDHTVRHGVAAMHGIQSAGLLPVGKHFPGHGDTIADSHTELPTAQAKLETLWQRELIPFQELIESGLPSIMSAHILVSAMEASCPGTLSPKVISKLLRQELGFDGLIITDDMEMGAIMKHYESSEAAVLALNAGCDLLLYCHRPDRQLAARDGLVKAVLNGRISETRLKQSLTRIDKVRNSLSALNPPDLGVIGCNNHKELLQQVQAMAKKSSQKE